MCICAIINMALLQGDREGYSRILRESPLPPSEMACLYPGRASKFLIERKRFHLIR